MFNEQGIDVTDEEENIFRRLAPNDTVENLLFQDMSKRRGSRVILKKQLPPIYTIIEIKGTKETVELGLSELLRV